MKIELEIGDNLKSVIENIVTAADRENGRSQYGHMSPGEEIKKAFKIDFTKITSKLIKNKDDSIVSSYKIEK